MITLLRLGLLMSLVAAVGCGGGTADISGKVTFKGKPVTYGTVMVLGSGGLPKSGVLRPDGTFTVTGVPLGPVKVAVSSPRPPGLADPQAKKVGRDAADDGDKILTPQAETDPAALAGWVEIPGDYGDPAKSNLTFEVRAGKSLDIDLK